MYRGGRCRSRRWKGYKRAPDVEDGGEAEREGLVDGQGPGLLGWCERFCGDTSPVKRFAFSRYIGGFDASVVESTLTSALRAINYKGNISVSVSCPNRSFAVYSPHLVNRLRDNSFVYYACVILQLWVITWPVIWALERRYEVVCPVWSFYRQVGSRREYARGRSEEEIADHLVPVVTQAACERRAGARFLTDQDFRILRRHGQDSGERVVVASWERVSGWGRDE
ncbi:hypothetical protein BDV25DRAFT_149553 [Aspergillus avenaceus]|uniref:Uncharacterized protein n=1 Tax=Aspergillus avenaceus TaxID=36643 RepID=A0A5N6U3W9_ASPAV|nr:hypothetical protein BDV25DRAFT_149553 [Aspergillus avenaceus]